VPTLIEQGVPISNYGWWGMCAAAGTPEPIIAKLNKTVVDAVNTDDYRTTMGNSGTIAAASTPAELGKIIDETVRDFDRLITDLGIKQLE
jgi:tripartite-type tricarboxylate transporter receptor subunit TctC